MHLCVYKYQKGPGGVVVLVGCVPSAATPTPTPELA